MEDDISLLNTSANACQLSPIIGSTKALNLGFALCSTILEFFYSLYFTEVQTHTRLY